MSDILVSELLTLVLLAFPLIRPFSKGLKRAKAISLFPFFAMLITVFIILGQGMFFSLVPIIFIVVLSIITEFARFVMLLRQVPNDFYAIPSKILRIFLIFLLAGCVFIVFSFSSEREIDCSFEGFKNEEIKLQEKTIGTHFFNLKKENQNLHILVLDGFNSITKNQNTITGYLINEGYSVSQLNLLSGIKTNSNLKIKRRQEFSRTLKMVLEQAGFKKPGLEAKLNSEKFNLIINKSLEAIQKNGKLIFVFSDGQYNEELYDYALKNPNTFAGIFFAADESKPFANKHNSISENNSINNFFILDERSNLKFSKDIAKFPYCLFIQGKEHLSEFGDLRGNDVLAATLLGSTRDIGRQDRILLAESFEKWLKLKY